MFSVYLTTLTQLNLQLLHPKINKQENRPIYSLGHNSVLLNLIIFLFSLVGNFFGGVSVQFKFKEVSSCVLPSITT